MNLFLQNLKSKINMLMITSIISGITNSYLKICPNKIVRKIVNNVKNIIVNVLENKFKIICFLLFIINSPRKQTLLL